MIYLGADHRGFKLKEKVKKWLEEWGYEFHDVGAFEYDQTDDFPVFASKVAESIIEPDDRGIIICGSGVGVDEVANKFDGIRSGLAINKEQIEAARSDDNINVLSLASDFIVEEDAQEIVKTFLKTDFSDEERFNRRLGEISDIEETN
ncbi:MAG: RpiB/LacA/LacB family sugar-phosphate isomerase [Candidatus Paceibacterota bacterium]